MPERCQSCQREDHGLGHTARHQAYGREARFCWECRPAVKRVRMRLARAGVAVTWSEDQVRMVRGELVAHGWTPAVTRKRGT